MTVRGRFAVGVRARISPLAMPLAIVLVPCTGHAHHGRDFLLTQTTELPHRGDVYLLSRQDFVDEGDEREIEFEPTVLWGATTRLTLEMHGHVERPSNGSFALESIAPALHLRLTPEWSAWGLALSAEYEFAREKEEEDRAEVGLALSRASTSSPRVVGPSRSGRALAWAEAGPTSACERLSPGACGEGNSSPAKTGNARARGCGVASAGASEQGWS